MTIPKPYFCRLEYYTPEGWKTGHAGIALLNPQRYVERLEERNKYGRALELGEDLKPTGKKWEPAKLPPRSKLVPTDTRQYGLPDPKRRGMCQWCEQYHGDPFDGSCLI